LTYHIKVQQIFFQSIIFTGIIYTYDLSDASWVAWLNLSSPLVIVNREKQRDFKNG